MRFDGGQRLLLRVAYKKFSAVGIVNDDILGSSRDTWIGRTNVRAIPDMDGGLIQRESYSSANRLWTFW